MVGLDRHEVGLQNAQTHPNAHDDSPSTDLIAKAAESQQKQRPQVGNDAKTEKTDGVLERDKIQVRHRDLFAAQQEPHAPPDVDQIQRDGRHQRPHQHGDVAGIVAVEFDKEHDGLPVPKEGGKPEKVAGASQHVEDRSAFDIGTNVIAREERNNHIHMHLPCASSFNNPTLYTYNVNSNIIVILLIWCLCATR